jgi:hypothetical protein
MEARLRRWKMAVARRRQKKAVRTRRFVDVATLRE